MAIQSRSSIVNKLKPDSSVGVEYTIAPQVLVDSTTLYTVSVPTLSKDESMAFKSDVARCLDKAVFSAKGDMVFADRAEAPVKLSIGGAGQFLVVSEAGVPEWSSEATVGVLSGKNDAVSINDLRKRIR
jgi:hypothetical protein